MAQYLSTQNPTLTRPNPTNRPNSLAKTQSPKPGPTPSKPFPETRARPLQPHHVVASPSPPLTTLDPTNPMGPKP